MFGTASFASVPFAGLQGAREYTFEGVCALELELAGTWNRTRAFSGQVDLNVGIYNFRSRAKSRRAALAIELANESESLYARLYTWTADLDLEVAFTPTFKVEKKYTSSWAVELGLESTIVADQFYRFDLGIALGVAGDYSRSRSSQLEGGAVELGLASTYTRNFWNRELAAGGDWSPEDSIANGWSEDVAVSGSWEPEEELT